MTTYSLGVTSRSQIFEKIVREHEYRVRRFVSVSIDDQSLLEDIVQEVFLTAWKKIDYLESFDQRVIFSWLCGTATRHLANHRRSTNRRDRKLQLFSKDNSVNHAEVVGPETNSISIDVLKALHRLPPDARMTLLLVLWDDAGPNEIAVAMQCSQIAAAKRIQRAMVLLREEYSKDD